MNEFREGWKTLFAATIGTMCGIFTLTNYTQGFFVGPVTAEFGWTPPQFLLSYTVMMCFVLVTGPAVGSIVERIGLRKVGLIGLIGHSNTRFSLHGFYNNRCSFKIYQIERRDISKGNVLKSWKQRTKVLFQHFIAACG